MASARRNARTGKLSLAFLQQNLPMRCKAGGGGIQQIERCRGVPPHASFGGRVGVAELV